MKYQKHFPGKMRVKQLMKIEKTSHTTKMKKTLLF